MWLGVTREGLEGALDRLLVRLLARQRRRALPLVQLVPRAPLQPAALVLAPQSRLQRLDQPRASLLHESIAAVQPPARREGGIGELCEERLARRCVLQRRAPAEPFGCGHEHVRTKQS